MYVPFFLDLTNMMTQPLRSTVITCMQHFTARSTRERESCFCPICTARVPCVFRYPTRCKPSKQPLTQPMYSHADMGNLLPSDHRETRNIVQSLWFRNPSRLSSVDTTTQCMRRRHRLYTEKAPLSAQGYSAPSQVFQQKNNPHNHREISTTTATRSGRRA
jgi:hypothetical protein